MNEVKPGVIVVGSVNDDLLMSLHRLPGPGETVTGGRAMRVGGGKGANQATAAARLGAAVFLIGLVGDDAPGRAARELLTSVGVDLRGLGTVTEPTGTAVVLVDATGENSIAVAPGANSELTAEKTRTAMLSIPLTDAVVVASLEVPQSAVLEAFQIAAERDWTTLLNPAPACALSEEILRLTDILTPNEHEVDALGQAGMRSLLECGVGTIVVTRGASGVEVHQSWGDAWLHAAFSVTTIDTTGAGDAFTGALAVALSAGETLRTAVSYACAAAALATTAIGAQAGLPDAAAVVKLREAAAEAEILARGELA
jgi:ribokinase